MAGAWGYLGKPPKDIMDGSADKDRMDSFKRFQREIEKAQNMADTRKRAIVMAEIRVKYLREFPTEGGQ